MFCRPSAEWRKVPNSAISELETVDASEITALSANGLLTVQVSTPRSPLWPLALSFRRLDRLSQDPTADLGIASLLVIFLTREHYTELRRSLSHMYLDEHSSGGNHHEEGRFGYCRINHYL